MSSPKELGFKSSNMGSGVTKGGTSTGISGILGSMVVLTTVGSATTGAECRL